MDNSHAFEYSTVSHCHIWIELLFNEKTMTIYIDYQCYIDSYNFLCRSFEIFPACHTSTSWRACTWTPQPLPRSSSSEPKVSIRIIFCSFGVSFRSTLAKRTWAFSTLSQITVVMSAGTETSTQVQKDPCVNFNKIRNKKVTDICRVGNWSEAWSNSVSSLIAQGLCLNLSNGMNLWEDIIF